VSDAAPVGGPPRTVTPATRLLPTLSNRFFGILRLQAVSVLRFDNELSLQRLLDVKRVPRAQSGTLRPTPLVRLGGFDRRQPI
jgi:hypothetical protein